MIMKDAWKENKKKVIIIGSLITACLIAAAGGIAYYVLQNRMPEEFGRPENGGAVQSDGSITASGTTMVGMVEDSYDIDYLENDLYIEEVCISSGDKIQEGDPILKLSEDTITAAQKQLEKAVTKAELDYRSGVINYNLSKAEAQLDSEGSIKKGGLAESAYADTLASAEQNITSLQKQIADSQEQLQEYQDAVNHDTYYEQYEVGYRKNIYDTNYAVFNERVTEWNLAQYMVTSDTDYSRYQFVSESKLQLEDSEREQLKQMSTFLSRVYGYLEEYESAKEEYETAKKEAAVQIDKLAVSIESLQLQLQEAQLNEGANQNMAKSEYETAVTDADAAQSTYNTAIKKLEEALESQQNEKEDAEEKLAHFEELVGDGYFKASSNGTALIVTSQEGTDLTEGTMVMAYSNPDTVTVAVSIDQTDIAALVIGDKAKVTIEDAGDYDAVITEIQPGSSSTSRSSVTYSVTVTLEGDVSALDVNMTAFVTFAPTEAGGKAK